MYARDAHPSYVSHANARTGNFLISINVSSGNTTLVYGSNWIASVGNFGAGNTATVTLKDNIFAVLDSSANFRDVTVSNSYATTGTFTNEASANALTFQIGAWLGGGGALNGTAMTTGAKISGQLLMNNGNVTTPGGN